MFTNVQEIIDLIEQRKNRGYGLPHFQNYMESIGNPQKALKAIHVAGTNGKGSTVNDLRSILQCAGNRVGSFTSPYMITHLDRIRINDVFICEEDFLSITNEYYDSWMEWNLSMFEIDMCIACVYFQIQKVDYCVFEVGLGGRLDATNILDPMVSVITNIGMDHMDLLGNTVSKIAYEKAGIIKEGKGVITAEEKSECLSVFETVATQHHTQIHTIQEISHIHQEEGHIVFDYGNLVGIKLAGGARYQCRNAALAIETIHYLTEQDQISVCDSQIRSALAQAIWIGRFEIVNTDPMILLDGAHNQDGIEALCASLQEIQNPIIIFSVLKDKNFSVMLEKLQQISDTIYVTQQHNQRALDIHTLSLQKGMYLIDTIEEALTLARKQKRPIVITGSLYFISEVRAKWFS